MPPQFEQTTIKGLMPISLDKLIAHESCAVKSRIEALPETTEPVIVKPLQYEGLYYIINGTNRVFRAITRNERSIECLVATPDYSTRINKIVESRIAASPSSPSKALKLVESDIERQKQFFFDTDRYSPVLRLKSERGTIIKIYVDIEFDGVVYKHFTLPLKGSLGGLILNPPKFLESINSSFVHPKRLLSCWGSDTEYDVKVLPSFIEVSEDGSDFYAGGYLLRQAFWAEPYKGLEQLYISGRGKIQAIRTFVLYPNGLVYEGPIGIKPETTAVLWSEHLLTMLNDPDICAGFTNDIHWWSNPTSILVNAKTGRSEEWCQSIEHTCGSTCAGGGCLI